MGTMSSPPRFAFSSDYLIALRSLNDLLRLNPALLESDTYLDFTERFPTMPTPQDFQLVLRTLKNLLIEFPDTTAPDAVSAKHQAREVLKKYAEHLQSRPHPVAQEEDS